MSYGHWAVEFDDRVLTHLQIVIINRLRKGESLLMSWIDAVGVGDGRSAIWMTPLTPIYFKFAGSRVPTIDTAWLKQLEASAASASGLIVADQTGRPIPAADHAGSNGIPRPSLLGRRNY